MTEEDLREVCALMPAAMTALQAAFVTTGGPAAVSTLLDQYPPIIIIMIILLKKQTFLIFICGSKNISSFCLPFSVTNRYFKVVTFSLWDIL